MSNPQDRRGTEDYGGSVQQGYGLQGAYGASQPTQGPYATPHTNPYPAVQPINQPPQVNSNSRTNDAWMNMPQSTTNCPPGLEYLTMVDQLLVAQKVELLDAFSGYQTGNRYTIKNSLGQKVYYAVEEPRCVELGPIRPFELRILDNFNKPIIFLHRPLACDTCLCPIWMQVLEVSAPPGNIIGRVEQEWSVWNTKFVIKNAADEAVLRIEGPFCTFKTCRDVQFKVVSLDGANQVGRISKRWSGLVQEALTDINHFGISFPMNLDVNIKAVMLGACFLIDAMFFNRPRQRNAQQQHPQSTVRPL